jgi:hypothetical protein
MHQVVDVFGLRRGAGNESPDRLVVSIIEVAEGTDLTTGQLSH